VCRASLLLASLGFTAYLGCTSAAKTGTGGATTATSATSASSTSSTTGAGGSRPADAGQDRAVGACSACDGACVDLANDPRSCGACGASCGAGLVCDRGACVIPTCGVEEPMCPVDHVCCGGSCCPPWEMCCDVPVDEGGVALACVSAEAGACPTTCAACP
jgi:hypothetical protein